MKQFINIVKRFFFDTRDEDDSFLDLEIKKQINNENITLSGRGLTGDEPELERLKECKKLKSLNLSHNVIQNLSFLKRLELTSIIDLNLDNNNIEDIGDLAAFTNLTSLSISNNKIIVLAPISNLTQLEKIYLNKNKITDLTPIGGLYNLIVLNIGNNAIRKIDVISSLNKITTLYLSCNKIVDLTPLVGHKELISLWINDNQVHSITLDFLVKIPNISHLSLSGNPIANIPSEIFNKQGNVLGNVQDYLNSVRDRGNVQPLNEAKLIFVGIGEVGKTELADALRNDNYKFNPTREQTEGIRIEKWIYKTHHSETLTLNIWDFAGQEVNYNLHQFFFTKNSIYIFVWDTRKGEEQSKFYYWLNITSSLSDGAPIFVVQNKIDFQKTNINERNWIETFDNISGFHETSCKNGEGILRLRSAIINEFAKLRSVKDVWNSDRFNVRKILENLPDDYISYKKYLDICGRNNLIQEEADFLAEQLHDVGVILYFSDNLYLKETIVLKPFWVTEAAYCLLKSPQVNRGSFHINSLQKIWGNMKFVGKHSYLLNIMKQFEFVFQLHGANVCIIPERLPVNSPLSPNATKPNSKKTKHLFFEYHYDFMPWGVFSRFICRVHECIYNKLYWKFGVMLEYEKSRAKVLLDTALRSTKKIKIEAWGDQADYLLFIIRKELKHIHDSLKISPLKEVIPCYCDKCRGGTSSPYLFSYSRLKKMQIKGKPTAMCDNMTDVRISQLLEGILYTQKESTQLNDFIDQGDYTSFFHEITLLKIKDSQVAKLRKEFIVKGNNSDDFAERIKVWILHYFEGY